MKSTLIPKIEEICEKFISNFINRNYQNIPPEKLIHDRTWKESEEKILDIAKDLFSLLENIWINPIFSSELAKSLNKGTYQLTVILLSIQMVLKNLPFRLSSFISTSEQQSIASADKKVLKPDKDQFGVVGVQVVGNMLYLNILVRDKANVH
ncbi:8229_t:CDS:2 [Ambispora leptoticha]|uniref:8229_t:CDS:1 n=1 Tax=Ambispora leptoticha TaxID=144679 RepID=A0A9N9F8D4_9GLOM|nr:8229_t:CDS:2 [Ambispora leptoticha]